MSAGAYYSKHPYVNDHLQKVDHSLGEGVKQQGPQFPVALA